MGRRAASRPGCFDPPNNGRLLGRDQRTKSFTAGRTTIEWAQLARSGPWFESRCFDRDLGHQRRGPRCPDSFSRLWGDLAPWTPFFLEAFPHTLTRHVSGGDVLVEGRRVSLPGTVCGPAIGNLGCQRACRSGFSSTPVLQQSMLGDLTQRLPIIGSVAPSATGR